MDLSDGPLLLVLIGLSLLPFVLAFVLSVTLNLLLRHGAWRLARALGRAAPYLLGSSHGESVAFDCEVTALREEGKIAEAAAQAKAHIAKKSVPAWSLNPAIDILISAGEYEAALSADPAPHMPSRAIDALGLALIQINLAEAEYSLGRWDQAEARLRPLDLACWRFPIAKAGLLQQRAWIAAHRGRAVEALELCASLNPKWLPSNFRTEYHFTRAAALLAAGRIDDAETAVRLAEALARRLSSKRNALFMRARVAAAREDWVSAERLCREAANHAFRGQGGTGLLLWAQTLRQLGQHAQAEEALRLVTERDPESNAAVTATESLAAAFGTRP